MRRTALIAAGGLALLVGGLLTSHGQQAGKAPDDKDREGDREAIRKSAYDFAQAFDKGDAKAIGALWTDQGEYHEDTGEVLRGKVAIEKAYAEYFKAKPKSKVEVDVRSVRFLAKDLAVEDGIVRVNPGGTELPGATYYSALHIREDGKWKLASVHETGGGEDKLDDLAWLIGKWAAKAKDREMEMSFEWNAKKTQIRNQFAVKEGGKVTVEGTQTIAFDPQTGQLRSWLNDDEGGHGQSLWHRDGNRWALESFGVLADGRETAAINLITRVNDDEFVWRSTNRVVGGEGIVDTAPVKLSRVKSAK